MADVYSNRLIGRLTNLAGMLERNGYRNESSLIRALSAKVGNWKNGYEWNEYNSLSIGDADHVLEAVVKTFTDTINEISRKKLIEKQNKPEENLEKDLEESLEKAIENFEDKIGELI